jgi:signal transduction histidine kinase/ActR/RegA family two-component response regulator
MALALSDSTSVREALSCDLPLLRKQLRADVVAVYECPERRNGKSEARLTTFDCEDRKRDKLSQLPQVIDAVAGRSAVRSQKNATAHASGALGAYERTAGLRWVMLEPIRARDEQLGLLLVGGTAALADRESAAQRLLPLYTRLAGAAIAREDAETQLKASNTQLANILGSSTEYAILTTDLDFLLLHHNPLAEELLTAAASWAPGTHITDLVGAKQLKRGQLREAGAAVRREGFWETEIRLPGDGGPENVRVVSLAVSAMRDPDHESAARRSKPIGYLIFARDVTEQRQRERALLDSQRMESIGLLAGGIAHDFNNILMGILGYASLAQDLTEPDTSVRRMLRTIEQSAERAASLTSQLMAYASGGKLASVAVDVEQLVVETLNILGSNMPRSVTIHRDYADELPCVIGDPTQLQQVVMNLCLNAGEAIVERVRTEAAGQPSGDVWVSARPVRLRRGQQSVFGGGGLPLEGKFVLIQVRDNGSGMSDETMNRIFEPFFTTKFTGRGLGLSAVQGIIHNHGGALMVASQLGVGTTFSVYLPATARTASLAVETTISTLEGSETVLIVDDEQVARQLGLLTLANLGYQVLLAADGEEGLSVFRQMRDSINLIVLDLTMPGLSGQDVLMEIALLGGQVPILLTSGYDQNSVGDIGSGKYLTGFLQKPYTPEQLARAVREVLDRKPQG